MSTEAVTSSSMIIAAGAIVRSWVVDCWEVAVVHRPRYDDWSIPKGKVKSCEPIEAAAVREVLEETGCAVRLISFAGTTRYDTSIGSKIVLYWFAEVESRGTFVPNFEIDRVEWLPIDAAIKRLSYAQEQTLLSTMSTKFERPGACASPKHGTRHHDRLCATLRALEIELRSYRFRVGFDEHGVTTEGLMAQARDSLLRGDYSGGWYFFHGARREMLFLQNEAELRARIATLRQESERKLGSWRRKAFDDLIPKKAEALPLLPSIVEAQRLVDEHVDNEWLKIWALRQQLQYLSVVIGSLLLALLATTLFSGGISNIVAAPGSCLYLLTATLLGVLAASFSGVLSTAEERFTGKIPERVVSNWIVLTRLLLGGGAALASYFLLGTDLVPLSAKLSPLGILGMSFIAGFSERFVLGAVSRFARVNDSKE